MEGILTISIEGDWSAGADTATVALAGFTTSATYYLQIVADAANCAVASGWDTTRYRLDMVTAAGISVTTTADVKYVGLQIDGGTGGQAIAFIGSAAVNKTYYIDSCRLRTASAAHDAVIINTYGGTETLYFYNTIIDKAGDHGVEIADVNAVTFYNCTIYGCTDHGISRSAGTVAAYNCVVFGNTTGDFNGTITVDHCASDEDTGTNNIAGNEADATWSTDFVDAANGNFTLLVGSPLIGATSDLSSGLFADDIAGTVRGAAWDVGAFEYVAAGGTTYTMVCADSIALGDSDRSTAIFLTSASDGLVLGDGGLGPVIFPNMAIDSIALGDLSVFMRTALGAASDSIILGDTAARIATLLGIAADSVALGDTAAYTILGAVEAFAADSVGLSDSARATATCLVVAGDSIALGDYSQRTFTVQMIAADGIALGDATIVQVAAIAQAVDGISLSDAAAALAAYIAAATDGVALQDVSISMGVLATGIVTVTFTTARGSVTITTKRPTVTLTVKEPSVILS